MKSILAAALICLVAVPAWARSDDAAELRQGCSELVDIYKARDQKKFLAMQTTSAAEALRAGYCRGVVIEYLRSNSYCSYGWPANDDWFAVARNVAAQGPGAVRDTLRAASCGR
jgi:hypothetical protein